MDTVMHKSLFVRIPLTANSFAHMNGCPHMNDAIEAALEQMAQEGTGARPNLASVSTTLISVFDYVATLLVTVIATYES